MTKISQNPGYITLKEAAELSGYSADYVGQLIRQGKLPGKRVYFNVAWVTTKEALEEYLGKSKKSEKKSGTSGGSALTIVERLRQLKANIAERINFVTAFKFALYAAIVLFTAFAVLLFYTFSVSFDRRLDQNAKEKARIKASQELNGNSR